MIDLKRMTQQVCCIAKEAGHFLFEERKKFRREEVETKKAHDYVSYVDKESEQFIVLKLSLLLPDAGFIAEEGSGTHGDEEYYWVVDPLDGTTNFIHNNAPYCVSIALCNREEILLGVVYEVCRDECFWAWKGSHAFMNGKEIHVSDTAKLDDAFIGLGLPYEAEKYKSTAVWLIDKLYGHTDGLRFLGASAAELCYLAAGRFDARIEAFIAPWDVTAGALILTQAGGKITDFKGGNTFYSGHEVLASNGKIHDVLINLLNRHFVIDKTS